MTSTLGPDEFARRLGDLVDEPRLRWPWQRSARSFEGRLAPGAFKIWPVVKSGHNSFIPVIQGQIEGAEGGSSVRLLMRLHWAVAALMAAWVGISLSLCARTLANPPPDGPFPAALGPGGAAVFVYAMSTVLFRLEVRKAFRLLAPLGHPTSASGADTTATS